MDARTQPASLEAIAPGQIAPKAAAPARRFALTPINLRRWQNFKANRRGYWSLWIFLALFIASLFAEFIVNDKPYYISFEGKSYFPVVVSYPETAFGGDFETAADYRDPFLQKLIADKGGYILWPPIRFSYDTHNLDLPTPAPSKPTWLLTEAECKPVVEKKQLTGCRDLEYNWLGTDDQGRDLVARMIYGFRVSVLFGLALTIISSIIGVAAGAVQGYFGGWTDLLFQRFIEIWTAIPELYLLLIISSILVPGFFILLGILLLFSWVSLVGLVRAEFLRGRNFEYIMAARSLGVSNATIMFRHLLPNAMGTTMTFLPFIVSSSAMTLTALDFLGVRLPPGSPSLGELLSQAKANVQAPWLGFTGCELLTATEDEMREIRGNDISIIFQEPMTSLNPLHTIEAQIGEILLLHSGTRGAMARARTLELLTQVGIPDPETRLKSYPHQLSGGQRQRVMIAMALANEPDLLIADEPTTALDVTVQAQILALLAEIRARLGMSMLFITHDLRIVRRIADVVCVMNGGNNVEQGLVEQVFTAPKHPYTRALLAAEPQPHPAPPRPASPVVTSAAALKARCPRKRGLLATTVGHIKAVDGVSLKVRKGETLGVVGESGSGKTTLGLALLRLISSDGPIVFLGSNIQGLRFKAMRPFRRDMQIVFQDPFGALSPRMSAGGIVAEGLSVHQGALAREEREARVIKALTDVGMDPATRFRYPHEFSGGQRQRISIARAVVLEPSFVVLDEPTSALDMLFQAQMVDLLRELQRKRDLTYMFISHDLRVVASLASHLIVMRHGRVVEEGPAMDLFKNPKSDYTRALFAAAFRLETAPDGSVAT